MKLLKIIFLNILFLGCFVGCNKAFDRLYSHVSVCGYPEALKKGLEKSLKKYCHEIEDEDFLHVESLDLTEIEEVEDVQSWQIENLENLKSLSFEGNYRLFEIPEFIYNLENLTSLDISETSVSDFDSKICQLKNLKSLIGRGNRYTNQEIPFHIFCIQNLETLDLSNSNIIYIDEYIYYLSQLKNLNLEGNRLSSVPYVLEEMSIQNLDLRNNNFENQTLNRLVNCQDQESCSDLKEYVCESASHRMQIDRGHPYRRYKNMTDEEFLKREEGVLAQQDSCYHNWLYLHGGFDDFEQTGGFDEDGNYKGFQTKNAHLLARTINGKTIREWRLAQMIYEKKVFGDLAGSDEFDVWEFDRFKYNFLKWIHTMSFSGCKWFGAEAVYWEPHLAELFPEKEKYKKTFSFQPGLVANYSPSTFIPKSYQEDESCRSEYDELSFEPEFEFSMESE